ncbi:MULTISPECIES: DegT/DnrJ/EryC1/StrS family aminotransferase [Pseudoalteromonas]|jgi:dTDP-4-amino-4,6-dideoxygalactose transaminase|uniref:Aminotransferase DegT n=1 Tax=Pseudoalteromonas aliena TaxID=247523 RepID=A0A1Q2GWC1_9GAMM|nr:MULTISPECIES: DegT/DnrJ/EryC1/StrS family aminotransferase [Pseudoalteromonas]AQP99429.1 aminotransferase DegT [Pseudoalteromonas aliena]MBE3672493.1 hypothetical protein [Pseudoalteromonas distincta KMM 3548]MDC3212109.1 DegT/DnrJ/EryC1/StrS family aminotransferase [Pseudoalteromonas distincta]
MIALNNPVKPNLKKLQKLLEKINASSWFTNFGPMHKELTERLEDYLCVQNLLLTNNGTSALQVAGRALNSKSIISTPFSFIATASAFKWQKDELAFADIDSQSLNICPQAIKAAYEDGCKADTLVATHVYGNPCDVNTLKVLAEKNNFKIIYDAAHAFGVKVNEQSVLNYGDASTLSFHATKVFHTVEGGAIIFKDRANYEKAERLINFGICHDEGETHIGINAKMNEYQAAVGLINLEEIDNVLNHRTELFYAYRQGLKDVVTLPLWHPESNANGAYMPILLKNKKQLKGVTQALDEKNIQSRHYFSPSLDTIFVNDHNYGTSNSLKASESILCLPLHAHLKLQDIAVVIENVKKGL